MQITRNHMSCRRRPFCMTRPRLYLWVILFIFVKVHEVFLQPKFLQDGRVLGVRERVIFVNWGCQRDVKGFTGNGIKILKDCRS